MTTQQGARRRRNRVLCLHGPTQSAASFRAALKPLCDQLGSHWEFHFLEAPYVVLDEGQEEESLDAWTRAAVAASRVTAMEGDALHAQLANIDGWMTLAREQLASTMEGREVLKTAHHEDIEGLVARKTGRSLSRNWITSFSGNVVGVQLALAQIGDYMRENGAFHGVIGYDTGARLALLLQSLLSHPLSSATPFPSFFPRLPKGVSRLPRMGGWEEEPPPPNDARLGAENLTSDFVPAQKPFEMVVALSSSTSSPLGKQEEEWMQKMPALVVSSSPDSFQVHTISIDARTPSVATEKTIVCKPGNEDILGVQPSQFLATWMSLAVDSCQGDSAARKSLLELGGIEAQSKL